MGALYIGGAVLYASKVPERWYKPPCEFNGIYLFCQCVGFLVNSITPFLQAIPYGTSSLSLQVRPFLHCLLSILISSAQDGCKCMLAFGPTSTGWSILVKFCKIVCKKGIYY